MCSSDLADTLDQVSASAADLYVSRTGMAKEKVMALMSAETWMNPEEAVANGFATSVSKEAKAIKNTFDTSVFKNTPEELKVVAEVVAHTEPEVAHTEPDVAHSEPELFDDTELRLKRIQIARRK